jgi:hypothetical protein
MALCTDAHGVMAGLDPGTQFTPPEPAVKMDARVKSGDDSGVVETLS